MTLEITTLSLTIFSPYTPGRGTRWFVKNYAALKKNQIAAIESPCFSVGGYLLRILLKYNKDESGTFLGVFLQNGPGPQDDYLVWPFPAAKVTFYLYNQNSDSSHLTTAFDTSTNWNAQPTTWRSWGRPNAWSFQEIERNMYGTKYIEGDTVVMGCMVTFTKTWLFSLSPCWNK
jgi:hypothetical protein